MKKTVTNFDLHKTVGRFKPTFDRTVQPHCHFDPEDVPLHFGIHFQDCVVDKMTVVTWHELKCQFSSLDIVVQFFILQTVIWRGNIKGEDASFLQNFPD